MLLNSIDPSLIESEGLKILHDRYRLKVVQDFLYPNK